MDNNNARELLSLLLGRLIGAEEPPLELGITPSDIDQIQEQTPMEQELFSPEEIMKLLGEKCDEVIDESQLWVPTVEELSGMVVELEAMDAAEDHKKSDMLHDFQDKYYGPRLIEPFQNLVLSLAEDTSKIEDPDALIKLYMYITIVHAQLVTITAGATQALISLARSHGKKSTITADPTWNLKWIPDIKDIQ